MSREFNFNLLSGPGQKIFLFRHSPWCSVSIFFKFYLINYSDRYWGYVSANRKILLHTNRLKINVCFSSRFLINLFEVIFEHYPLRCVLHISNYTVRSATQKPPALVLIRNLYNFHLFFDSAHYIHQGVIT